MSICLDGAVENVLIDMVRLTAKYLAPLIVQHIGGAIIETRINIERWQVLTLSSIILMPQEVTRTIAQVGMHRNHASLGQV